MKRIYKSVVGILTAVMAMFLFMVDIASANEEFAIHFIDVGQADAAVILCDDEVLMIDGGNAEDSGLIYSYLSNTLGIEHIDYMIATHAHEDHVGGLSGALNACTVGTVYSPVTEYDSKAFESLVKYVHEQGLELTVPSVGDMFNVGSASVQILSPAYLYADTNDTSIVVRIVYGETSFMFTGDAEWEAEHDMVDAGYDLSATLLKVGHHGSDTSSSYVFLREVMPEYAVISVGEDNSYGHPTEDTLSRLYDAGATVYRTDLQGDIICYSDGNALTFVTEMDAPSDEVNTGETTWDWGTSVEDEEEVVVFDESGEASYIGNKNTKKLHYADCSSVNDMKDTNKVEFYTRDEPINQGYVPCKRCNP